MNIENARNAPRSPERAGRIPEQNAEKMLPRGVENGFRALSEVIGREEVRAAYQTMLKYRQGKANLEQKIIANEQWYKMRHWECMQDKKQEVQPVSGWLLNSILNKHADAMDNYPSPNVLPREASDKAEAKMLSSILPVILDQCGFEQVYNDVWYYKLKTGTGAYAVYWDKDAHGGLGEIAIRKVDLLNLFWEPGISDIQNSRNLFHVELMDNELLIERYPKLSGKLGSDSGAVSTYLYDDTVDTSTKSLVVDWYYRKAGAGGKPVLHFCKFVCGEVLFATENEPDFAEKGLYDHGEYPFVFDVLYPLEGTPAGFGYIDIGKDAQAYIDRGNQAILKNLLTNAAPRHFVSKASGINLEEYADLSREFVEYEGSPDGIKPVTPNVLSDIYLSIISNKVEELKEVTGNRDVSTGGTTSGVTAASGIAAMQEAGGKISRDSNKSAYRAFRRIVLMMIELIRQFYDTPRYFRILGESGGEEFVRYSNAGLVGSGEEHRVPLFDIEVTAQKASPYSKMAQNELALQFFGAGFFNPQLADQALSCLDMMDFDRKAFVMERVAQNGGMHQQLQIMQQQILAMAKELDAIKGTNTAAQMAAGMGASLPAMPGAVPDRKDPTAESSQTKNARQRAAETASPT
ncbi:MAG: hypothetical protein IJD10_07085 [Clostridia bacterium]|nr:hypothetical protein [Clostridia bacterium]